MLILEIKINWVNNETYGLNKYLIPLVKFLNSI